MTEIMVIVAVGLLVFGPKQLPKIGRSLGDGIREFRRAGKQLTAELEKMDEQA